MYYLKRRRLKEGSSLHYWIGCTKTNNLTTSFCTETFHKVWIIKCFTASEEGGRKQKAEQICSEPRLETKQRSCAKQQELQRRSSHPSSSGSPGQAGLGLG